VTDVKAKEMLFYASIIQDLSVKSHQVIEAHADYATAARSWNALGLWKIIRITQSARKQPSSGEAFSYPQTRTHRTNRNTPQDLGERVQGVYISESFTGDKL